MFKFYKYNSLGNDFIVFDWLSIPEQNIANILNSKNFTRFIIDICQAHFGVGADGVLIIKKNKDITEGMIFNADGSNGKKCLNGIRCIAHYLYKYKNYPEQFMLQMSGDIIPCKILDKKIDLSIKNVKYINPADIILSSSNINLSGHIVDAGNPHFVVLKSVGKKWLLQHGEAIENHPKFPQKTNVEFVEEIKTSTGKRQFNLLVHERGCGMTMACGSGAAAAVKTLFHLNIIKSNEQILISMPGGTLETYIAQDGGIVQIGEATSVYSAEFLIDYGIKI